MMSIEYDDGAVAFLVEFYFKYISWSPFAYMLSELSEGETDNNKLWK